MTILDFVIGSLIGSVIVAVWLAFVLVATLAAVIALKKLTRHIQANESHKRRSLRTSNAVSKENRHVL